MISLGALACVLAGLGLICAAIVFIRHEVDAYWWRRACRGFRGGEKAARRFVLDTEDLKKRDEQLQRELDEALARKAFDAYRRNVLRFPPIKNRGREVRFTPDGAA